MDDCGVWVAREYERGLLLLLIAGADDCDWDKAGKGILEMIGIVALPKAEVGGLSAAGVELTPDGLIGLTH